MDLLQEPIRHVQEEEEDTKMESIIFIAPPAAGKGTLSNMLVNEYHMPHISTGDLLRDEVKNDTLEANELKAKMEAGLLISDDIILNLLEKRICLEDCNQGYILDGFPRTIAQAKAYEKILEKLHKPLGKVIYVGVSKKTALNRIVGRISCPKCKAVYNELLEESKPQKKGICDKCGHTLVKRNDDTIETFTVRFDTYLENTAPLIQYYESKGLLYRIPDDLPKERAYKEVIKIMNGGNEHDSY